MIFSTRFLLNFKLQLFPEFAVELCKVGVEPGSNQLPNNQAAEIQTPCYFYSVGQLERNVAKMRDHLESLGLPELSYRFLGSHTQRMVTSEARAEVMRRFLFATWESGRSGLALQGLQQLGAQGGGDPALLWLMAMVAVDEGSLELARTLLPRVLALPPGELSAARRERAEQALSALPVN